MARTDARTKGLWATEKRVRSAEPCQEQGSLDGTCHTDRLQHWEAVTPKLTCRGRWRDILNAVTICGNLYDGPPRPSLWDGGSRRPRRAIVQNLSL